MIIQSRNAAGWVIDAYRADYEDNSYKAALSKLAKDGFVCGFVHKYGRTIQVVASTDVGALECVDFATALAVSTDYKEIAKFVYIERLPGESQPFILIELAKGVPQRSLVIDSIDEVAEELDFYCDAQGEYEVYSFGLNSLLANQDWDVQLLPSALTEGVTPFKDAALKPIKDIHLSNKHSGKRKAVFVAAALLVLGVAFSKWHSNPPESDVTPQASVVKPSPWASYEQAITTNAIYAYERLLQDFAFHQLFNNGPGAKGWIIKGVDVTSHGHAYRIARSGTASDKDLESFTRSEPLKSVVGEPVLDRSANEITLRLQGRNRPLPFADFESILDVREVQHLFTEAVTAYLPGSDLRFIRDHEEGNFVKRQVELQFQSVYWQDLIGFGAMTRKYPVSLGRVTGDNSVGGYAVSSDGKRLTGSLLITLVGEKR